MRQSSAGFTLENNFLFYTALVLAVAPIWVYDFLPGVDLPGHAAQIAALQELWIGNPLFTSEFEINYRTPYLVPTMVATGLSMVTSVYVAIKILLTLVIVATPILYTSLANAVGADPRWRWLVLPSTYSYAFYWGFFPYVLSVPLGFAFLLLAIKFSQRPNLLRALAVAGSSIALLASHIFVLGFSSLMALMWILGSNYRQPMKVVKLSLPFLAPVPFMGLWLLSAMNSGTYISDRTLLFDPVHIRFIQLVLQPSGTDGSLLLVSLAISSAILALPFLCGARLTASPGRWAMAISGLLVFMTFPSLAMGTAHVYQRFGVFLPVLWFLLWEIDSVKTRRWDWTGMAAVISWIILISLQLSAFNIEAAGFKKIMQAIEPGKRVASMPAVHRSRHFVYPAYLHFPEWYQVLGRGVVDFNFSQFYNTVVTYRPERRAPYGDHLAWRPDYFDWAANGGDTYDYFVVHADIDISEPIFKGRIDSVELVLKEGWWWLYKRVDPVPDPSD